MAAQQRARGEESAPKVGESSADLRAPASDECGAAAALGLQDSALGTAINSALQIYFSNTAQRQRQRQAAPRATAPQAVADRATTPPPSTARASASCGALVLQTPPKPRRVRHQETSGARDSPASSGDELGGGAAAPAPVPWDSPGMAVPHYPCSPGGKDQSVPCTPLSPRDHFEYESVGHPQHFLGWAGWSLAGEEYPASEHIAATFSPRQEAWQAAHTEWGPVPQSGYDNWSWPAWNSYQFPPTCQPQGLASAGLPPGCFKFTLRKADGNSLGLIVSHKETEFIRVEEVQQGGAVDAWNRQCVGNVAWKAVRPGDLIIEVNGKDGSAAMFSEIKSRQLLRITIFRGTGGYQRPIRKFKCGEELETDVLAGLLEQ